MKPFYLAVLITATFLYSCRAQSTPGPKVIFNEQFNWRIQIPEGFETVPAEQWMKMQNKGAGAVEKTYDVTVENRAKTIFAFRSDQFNYFESNYQPFDTAADGNYLESFRQVNNMLYGTFEAQMPQAKLDSASSQETIDGKLFQVYKITITIPGKIVIEFWMYSRLFGKREFTVNIMTVDKEKQRILLNAWRNSKFGAK